MDKYENLHHLPVATPDVQRIVLGESFPITPDPNFAISSNYGSNPYLFGTRAFDGSGTLPFTQLYGGYVPPNYQQIQQAEIGFHWPMPSPTVSFTVPPTNQLYNDYYRNIENTVSTPFYSPPPDRMVEQADTNPQSMSLSTNPEQPTNSNMPLPPRLYSPTSEPDQTLPTEQSEPKLLNLRASEWRCDQCNRNFVSQNGLKHHKIALHTGVRPHRCSTCGKRFSELMVLQRHTLRHITQNKPFRCDHCPKTFCYRADLRRHEYNHTGAAPHRCTVCAKAFARRDHMQKHEQVHQQQELRRKLQTMDCVET
uniref:C2H2-type domain-containing protein n=1 Tax=Anopheles minimus TaxID=112268 RepID=A0A182VRL6_9DIPT